jgi:hypothetical protein
MPPVYEALLLNTVVPQIQAAQAGDSYVMVVNATTPALRITQTGTGDAILVEDSANPDATPFVVLAAGDVGIGTNAPLAKLHVAGEARFVSGAATQPAITITQGFINADISSANFTIGNFGDNSSEMRVATRGFTTFFTGATNNSTGTERMRLDSSGNLGLGVTPSPWGTDYKAIQIGGSATGALSYKNFVTSLSQNVYSTNANDVALVAGNSAKYELNGSGEHVWKTATAVTANTTTITNGVSYTIITSGNQTAFGAANNNVGTSFTATSSGTLSSGTVSQNISFTQAMTLDASGNLIIGDTSGTSTLNLVRGGSDSTEIKLKQTGTGGRDYRILSSGSGYGSAGNLIFYDVTASAERVRIDSSGNLTIGNSKNLYFNDSGTGIYGEAGGSGLISFKTNGSERARITSGGYFKASNSGAYDGVSSAYHELYQSADNRAVIIANVNASATTDGVVFVRADRNTTSNTFYALSYYNAGAAAYKFRVADSGDVTNTNGTYGTISDQKMKTDIVDAGSQWSDIKALRFRKFKMKDDPDQRVQLGVVAQEVELTSPGLVDEHQDRDGEGNDLGTTTKSVKTSVLLMKAAVALQEAMARIETLEAEVAALKGA